MFSKKYQHTSSGSWVTDSVNSEEGAQFSRRKSTKGHFPAANLPDIIPDNHLNQAFLDYH